MAEFCKCGSLIVSDKCSNKNCAFKTDKVVGGAVAKKSAAEKKSKTTTSTRRSSKCVTYSIDELADRDPRYKDDNDADEDNAESGYDEDYERYEEEEEP